MWGIQAVHDPEHIFLMGEKYHLSSESLQTGDGSVNFFFLQLSSNIFNLSKKFELSGRGKSQLHISVQWRGHAQTVTGMTDGNKPTANICSQMISKCLQVIDMLTETGILEWYTQTHTHKVKFPG